MIVFVFVALLYGLPILWNAQKNSLLKSFTFIELIKTINKSLIIQIVTGLILIPLFRLLDYLDFVFLDLILVISWTYLLVGIYWYLPTLGILNIIKMIANKKLKRNNSI